MEKIEYEEIINAPSFPYASFLKTIVKFNVMVTKMNDESIKIKM